MLDKQDKQWLENTIERKITEALTVEVQYEKFDKERGLKELKTEDVYLPVWWVQYLPEFMGSFRGLQEDVNKASNKMMNTQEGLQAMADVLMNIEHGVKQFIEMGNKMEQLSGTIEAKQLEQ